MYVCVYIYKHRYMYITESLFCTTDINTHKHTHTHTRATKEKPKDARSSHRIKATSAADFEGLCRQQITVASIRQYKAAKSPGGKLELEQNGLGTGRKRFQSNRQRSTFKRSD